MYSWSAVNGTITGGSGTPNVTFTAGRSGSVGLSVTVTNAQGCSASNTASISIGGTCAQSLYTVQPCRVVDTRGPNAPALAAQYFRTFPVTGLCGIPYTALAVSANLTVTQGTDFGDLRAFPDGGPFPPTSVINYGPGQTRANNAILSLGPHGQIVIQCDQAIGGTVEFILDVTGYFQ